MEVAGKYAGGASYLAGIGSVAINGVRYNRGDIGGAEFAYSSYVTGLAIGSSVAFGPEAGVAVEGLGWAGQQFYNGLNTAIEQASWGITNWEHNFQNAVAGRIIGY